MVVSHPSNKYQTFANKQAFSVWSIMLCLLKVSTQKDFDIGYTLQFCTLVIKLRVTAICFF